MKTNGYQVIDGPQQFKILWSSLSEFPEDRRLVSCGECTSGCSRCNCGTNQVPCTIYGKCKNDCCKNRSTTTVESNILNYIRII